MKTQDFWDKSCMGKDKTNEMPHLWGNIIYFVLYPLGKLLWRIKVKNIDRLRAFKGKSGVLLISNHTSYIETYLMYCCVRLKQWCRFMARSTLFDHKLLGWFLSRAGVFPIKRDTADTTSLKRAAKMLKNKEIVGIFPEGTRRGKSNKEPYLHSGAAFIARLGGNVPILPMTCRNADKIKTKGHFIRFPKITVEFGNPIFLSDFNFIEKERRYEAITWYSMRECFALFYQISPEKVDMKSLFPKTYDYSEFFLKHPIKRHSVNEI